MHQTFYIDIDEEITSIIDRLKHAKAKEIVMVVPKRALLVQSIVNLRILKKEADEAALQLMIVTQDKLGKLLIEKAGIFVQQKMDNIADDEISVEAEEVPESEEPAESEEHIVEASNERLEKIGSTNFFSAESQAGSAKDEIVKAKKSSPKKSDREKLVNKELVLGIGSDIRKKDQEPSYENEPAPAQPEPAAHVQKVSIPHIERQSAPKAAAENFPSLKKPKLDLEAPVGAKDHERVQNFFYQRDNAEKRPNKVYKTEEEVSVSGKFHLWFWVFGIVSLLIFAGIAAYLFVPKVKLTIGIVTASKSIDSEITGKVSAAGVDYETQLIPAKSVEVEHEVVKSLSASGSKSVSNQKARGKITIYNEYDTNPQPLVATTRFLSKDGKLFRLVKGVTVPGMKKTGENSEKGSIEAEVVADRAGEEFNIEPTSFTIPGFENSGNDKYLKFYAESSKSMSGGGSGSQEANFVAAEDIVSAKEAVKGDIESALKQEIKKRAVSQFGYESEDEVILIDGAISQEEPVYKLSNSQGDVVDTFEITSQVKAKALIVNKKDLDSLVARMIARSGNGQVDIDGESLALTFGKPIVDFEGGIIEIKFHATGKLQPNMDTAAIRSDILGKKEENLKEYLQSFNEIERIQLSYWPSFINGRIPFRASQVEVVLDKDKK